MYGEEEAELLNFFTFCKLLKEYYIFIEEFFLFLVSSLFFILLRRRTDKLKWVILELNPYKKN